MSEVTKELARSLRAANPGSVAALSRRLGLPRSWFYKAESGKFDTRVSTLADAGEKCGLSLSLVPHPLTVGRVSTSLAERLERLATTPEEARAEAQENLVDLIEADCKAEKLDTRFSQISVLVEGWTVAGDPLDITRAKELVRAAKDSLQESTGKEELRAFSARGEIRSLQDLPSPLRELRFLASGIEGGADPTLTRYEVNQHLLDQGLPWLGPLYKTTDDYRRALAISKMTGNGDPLIEYLIKCAEERRSEYLQPDRVFCS